MMGILLLQRDKKWRVEIREMWKVSTQREKDDLEEFLNRHKVKRTVDYVENDTIFNFDNSSIVFKDYKEFVITVNQLLEYKRNHTEER